MRFIRFSSLLMNRFVDIFHDCVVMLRRVVARHGQRGDDTGLRLHFPDALRDVRKAAASMGSDHVDRLAGQVGLVQEYPKRRADGVVPDRRYQPNRILAADILQMRRQLRLQLVDVLALAHLHGLVVV